MSNFGARLLPAGPKMSWPGRKRSYDNILVDRLWRTIKPEEDDLHAYRVV